MKFRLTLTIFIGVLLSIVTSKIVYFGFTPNYGGATLFSRDGLHFQFDHDVFKYRILSRYIFNIVDSALSNKFTDTSNDPRILAIASNASQRLYNSFYYLNTFFTSLTSIVLILILRLTKSTTTEKFIILFLSVLIISFSQFTVTYYDTSSYFFQLLTIYIYLKYHDSFFYSAVVAMSLLTVLSTLNRESSAISVAVITLLTILKFGVTKKSLAAVSLLSFAFIFTYLLLRATIFDPKDIKLKFKDAGNLQYEINIIGMLFWVLFFSLSLGISNCLENKLLIILFHIICAPYIYICLKYGVMWEVRLYIPLFLNSVILSKVDISNLKFQPTNILGKFNKST